MIADEDGIETLLLGQHGEIDEAPCVELLRRRLIAESEHRHPPA